MLNNRSLQVRFSGQQSAHRDKGWENSYNVVLNDQNPWQPLSKFRMAGPKLAHQSKG